MPRNMSFSHTTDQIRDRTKTVTRRLGWKNLKPGERFWAVKKAMGLRPGEKIERLALLECVSNRREELWRVKGDDAIREGFPGLTPDEFCTMFRRIAGCKLNTEVSRIEFRYVEAHQ